MKTVIVGAGGQARIVYEILRTSYNLEIVAFIDNVKPTEEEYIMGIPVVGDHSVVPGLIQQGVKGAVIGIGPNDIRAKHFKAFSAMGLEMINAIHSTAIIAPSVNLGRGVTIAMGAKISTVTNIGDNAIINTGANVDHENEIGDHVQIGPGCSLAGRVTVKNGAFIGIGSVVKEYITIGENAVIGAGSVVLEDIPDNITVAGAPAKIISKR